MGGFVQLQNFYSFIKLALGNLEGIGFCGIFLLFCGVQSANAGFG